MDRVIHSINPIYNEVSKVLILGTFPSVKSREGDFFYHHPQNRFWKVISAVYNEPLPFTIEEKKNLLLGNQVAVWDVIKSCEIIGSSDSSIKNVIPNDLSELLHTTKITRLFANGSSAYQFYMKYTYPNTGLEITKLPSTSPANASYRLEQLIREWSCINNE